MRVTVSVEGRALSLFLQPSAWDKAKALQVLARAFAADGSLLLSAAGAGATSPSTAGTAAADCASEGESGLSVSPSRF